jgi:hypothetical protein
MTDPNEDRLKRFGGHENEELWNPGLLFLCKERDNIMTKDSTNEQNNNRYTVKVKETPKGELFIELPQKLMDQLDWKIGDDVEWEETEIGEVWGEHMGFTLSNTAKRKRDAEQKWKNAESIDME